MLFGIVAFWTMLGLMAVVAMKPKNVVESLRDIVQDLLVPELKAIKTELESQRRETHLQFENVRNEFGFVRSEARTTGEALRADTEALRVELRIRDERQTQAMLALSDRLGTLMEVRERLAVLEAGARHA